MLLSAKDVAEYHIITTQVTSGIVEDRDRLAILLEAIWDISRRRFLEETIHAIETRTSEHATIPQRLVYVASEDLDKIYAPLT